MTLKEFIKLNINDHYRIYQPNRDCLIFESYFKVHSPYKFDNEDYEFNPNYYKDNDYCEDVYIKSTKNMDSETKTFLKRFGKYKVTHLECSSFTPTRIKETDGSIKVELVRSESRPNCQDLPCFNVFIVPTR